MSKVKKVVSRSNYGRFAKKAKEPTVIYIRNIEKRVRDYVTKTIAEERVTLAEFFTDLISDHKSKKTRKVK